MNKQCVEVEVEYLEWRKAPKWYCVKTTFHNNGKIESEIVRDEKTKLPIAIQDFEKPQDGVFETAEATVYYTYHQGYKEAERQMNAAKAAMRV